MIKMGSYLSKQEDKKNRLYKVRMGIKDAICLLSTTTSESSRWNARLGYINLDTIKSMVKRELVSGIPHINFEKRVASHAYLVSK